ncbi:MAG: TonB-dependent receptor [Marinifilaceae bacterium]|jgi:outer membrane receptor protein involved in Fe transport|nr:TonB-dependent receptor [Marinifilaceae bacterium]
MKTLGKITLLILALLININTIAQQKKCLITGVVIEKESNKTIEYATIALYNQTNNKLVTGSISNIKGIFKIENINSGIYYIQLSFIGFRDKKISNIKITDNLKTIDLGIISLEHSKNQLAEINIITDKKPIKYAIDKKLISVSNHITASGGNAIDILENATSVDVDLEGNISIRGNSNFTVLVDGKPTILDAFEILEQTPANQIENIEIITNPSVKYNPDGTGGIINIITKTTIDRGISGIFNFNLGNQDNRGSDILFNYRKSELNLFAGLTASKKGTISDDYTKDERFTDIGTNTIISEGRSRKQLISYDFKTGIEYKLNKKDIIGLNLNLGIRDKSISTNLIYNKNIINETQTINSLSIDNWKKDSKYINASLSYLKKFNKNKWSTHISYGNNDSSEKSENKESINNNIIDAKIAKEFGPGRKLEIQSDLELNIFDTKKLELGYQASLRKNTDETRNLEYIDNVYIENLRFRHKIDYSKDIHAIYGIISEKRNKFNYQIGFRTEYTKRKIEFAGENTKFNSTKIDFFPSLHSSYNISDKEEIIASYTKRINRPRGWELEPFLTWEDSYNVKKGNPDLKPEYIDAYELNFVKRIGKQNISIETYYIKTNDKIEKIKSPYDTNIMMNTTSNIGKEHSYGIELGLNINIGRKIKNNLITNLYKYKVNGNYNTIDSDGNDINHKITNESNNWGIKNNLSFIINKNNRIQFNSIFKSKTKWAQGERKAYFINSAAYRRLFFNGKLTANLQIKDIFGTGKQESISEYITYKNYSKIDFKNPKIKLNLSFKLNKLKKIQNDSKNNIDDFEI